MNGGSIVISSPMSLRAKGREKSTEIIIMNDQAPVTFVL